MEDYALLQNIQKMDVDVLKLKVINDFKKLITALEKGHVTNYDKLMLDILYIEYGNYEDVKLFEFLLNN